MLLLPLLCLLLVSVDGQKIGRPNPYRTTGSVWPFPQNLTESPDCSSITVDKFKFQVTGETCDILQHAVERYAKVVVGGGMAGASGCDSPHDLASLQVELTSPCERLPHAAMMENYELHISNESAILKSDSIWGILRGLESFSQLVTPSSQPGCLVVNHTDILDYPRFGHRGLLLDTSRHYLPVNVILNIIAGMEMNKMNVFHWHIVDHESFPYQSVTFPSLSEKGAYDPKKAIYTQEAIASIVEFARLRGIRVLPEFDSPDHSRSWGRGVSKLLTPCFSNGTFSGNFGPVDPTRQENYKFMASLLKEVKAVFPESYMHLGGDEIEYGCWESNPTIQKFMEEKHLQSMDELENYYFNEMFAILNKIGAKGIVWEEVFVHNVTLTNTVVQIWNSNRNKLLDEVTSRGLPALLSQGWYLDHLQDQWEDFYAVDPSDFNGTHAQKELVLGGEACMWGEMVDESNIVPRTWPRASAVAERLWSSAKVNDTEAAAPRLNEHVCRMKRRGVAAQPANGPGYCPY